MINLSIIICTWNNCRRLEITLNAIMQCRIPAGVRWELVIVNNNCTDDTDSVIHFFQKKLPLLYVHEPIQGLSRARNAGIFSASGDLVVFTDDDVKPCIGWIEAYWSAYKRFPEGNFWGGPVESEFETREAGIDGDLLSLAPASVKGIEWGNQPRRLASGETFIAANWACPRKVLVSTKGFNTALGLDPSSGKVRTGEESDIMNRLKQAGLTAFYLPSAKILHFVPKKKMTLQHIAERYGATGYAYGLIRRAELKKTYSINRERSLLLLRLIAAIVKYCFTVCTGGKGYGEYFRIKLRMGMLKALLR